MSKSFPIVEAGHIFNEFNKKKFNNLMLKLNGISIDYPCRLDAMAINPAAVCYNDEMVFTPGEVVISLKKFIKVKTEVISESGGILKISKRTKRKVLVKHAYLLMCKALGVSPSLKIDVNDSDIPKHCGFGSSSSTIASVAASINELYGCPINNDDLIQYLASNHGEEVSNNDENNLKIVQCIGGGATSGLSEEGILIIAGKATKIAKIKYERKVLIGIPNDFVEKNAKVLMELEEKNLYKFKATGLKYADKIAYNLLHISIPQMLNGSIKELADLVFDYRFNMGSNENCSFVYDGLMDTSNKIRKLYENKNCNFLALSSVGPSFFLMVDKNQEEKCKQEMKKMNLKVFPSSICNTKYIVKSVKKRDCFWQNTSTGSSFRNRPPSKYITNQIDKIDPKGKKAIDIGCGGGRYTRYLHNKGFITLGHDKHMEMFDDPINNGINFIVSNMTNIPVANNSYDLVLSIGVIHNSVTKEEYIDALKEIYRILTNKGKVILSTFTNDVITDDLIKISVNKYEVKNRDPMILLSKNKIKKIIEHIGFKNIKEVEEHITDVGSGKRNVYTLTFEK